MKKEKLNKDYVKERLNYIREDLKLLRAFLQGMAYSNGCKSDAEMHIENAWHYSDRARISTIWIDDILNHLGKTR